jgi:outer membrane protein OmpA-like peptidoglycan-associated protein
MEQRAAILMIAVLLAAGCAKGPTPEVDSSSRPPATTPPSAPFTDRELADELRRQGIAAASGQTSPSEDLPEISETPRGVVITLPYTHFAFDSYDLDAKARGVVERIAYVLNHPRAVERTVVLEGHADTIGTEAYNLTLSRRRAETVARELIVQGVLRDRITIEAFGESRPIAPNQKPDGTDDPAGRAKNRRVEAVIRK